MEKNEIKEAKSLRWLSHQLPYAKNPANDGDRLCNAIVTYAKAGAEKIEAQAKEIESLKAEINALRTLGVHGDA